MVLFSLTALLVVSLLPHAPIAYAASHVYEQTDKIGNPVFMGTTAALAIDSAGNYYTTTYDSNGYIRRFSPTGEQLPSFGTEEQTWTGEPGMHGYAYHIAFKSNGEMYVADSDNLRINIYSAAGEYLRAISSQASGQPFTYNWRFAFGPDDKLYVIDNDTTIHVYDSNDTYLSSFSNPGIGDGQFSEAWGIDIDASGNIFVADYGAERIVMYDSSWNFVRNIGTGSITTGGPDDLHVDNGYAYTIADWVVKKYNISDGSYVQNIGVKDVLENGGYGVANGETLSIRDFVIKPNGDVAVLESYPSRIQSFTNTGTYLGQFGQHGSEPSQFGVGLINITSDTSGNIYVPDTYNERIQKFDPAGNFLMEFGNSTTFLGLPRAAAVSPVNGDIYVFDGVSGVCTSRILVFDPLGVQKGTLASCGAGDGQFKNLGVLLEIDANGNIFIGDPLNDIGSRVLAYDASGTFLRQWLVTLKTGNSLGTMTGIDVGPDGNIYAVTGGSSYIFKYDTSGNLLAMLGNRAPGTAAEAIARPETSKSVTTDQFMCQKMALGVYQYLTLAVTSYVRLDQKVLATITSPTHKHLPSRTVD